MVDEILTTAGIPGRDSRYAKHPAGIYAVWFDDIETDGPDDMPPSIFKHNVTVEVYEPKKDNVAISSLEASMTAKGVHWTKQARLWIKTEQMYQTIYEFTYIEKRRT